MNGLPISSDGRISCTTSGAVATAQGGLTFDVNGDLCVVDGTGTVANVLNGLPFDSTGRLMTNTGGTAASYLRGLAFDSGGRLIADGTNAATGMSGGWPLSGGAVAFSGLSAYQLRHFWDEQAHTAAPGGNKTLLTVALMSALGYTSSGGSNGTIIGSDGTLQAASAPRITYDRGASSNWLSQSDDLTQWTATGVTAPTPLSFAESATTSVHQFVRSGLSFSGTFVVTAEVLIPSGRGLYLIAEHGSGGHQLRVTSAGVVTQSTWGTPTGTATLLESNVGPDGYRRMTFCVTGASVAFTQYILRATDAAVADTYPGVLGTTFLVRNMDVQSGNVRTPHLKTTTTAPLYTAGTPRSQNLFDWSENFANGVGNWYNVFTATGSGNTVTWAATNDRMENSGVYCTPGCVYTVQASVIGSGQLIVNMVEAGGGFNGLGSQTINLTGSHQSVKFTFVATSTVNGRSIVQLRSGSGAGNVTVTGLRIYEGTADLAYTKTTGTPYSLYYQQGLITEAARTRETLHPFDLTQAAWSCTNITPAKTAIGLPGTANSATTLTATATNGTCLQALTSASANRLLPVWIRSRSASSLTIDLTCDGGTTWVAKTVNAAYMPYMVNQASVTNPSYGIRLRASGDSIDVGYIGGEQYTTLPAVPPMPIWGTESAAQSKSADLVIGPAGLVSTTGPQTTVVAFVPSKAANGASSQMLLAAGSQGQAASLDSTGKGLFYDGVNFPTSGGAAIDGATNRLATRYGSTSGAVCLNGGTIVTGSFDGSMGSGGAVGIGQNNSGIQPFTGLIGSLEIANAAFNDANLQRAAQGLVA